MSISKEAFKLAVLNISKQGDTDVLPYPVDVSVFRDNSEMVVDLLCHIDRQHPIRQAYSAHPMSREVILASAGYSGFRPITQIDAIWNAYLLGAVLNLGESIEKNRISVGENTVFSYRYAPDDCSGSLFDRTSGWVQFQQEAVKRARKSKYVVSCDISDFYSRIYHHPLENALLRVASEQSDVRKIMSVLQDISLGASYGLPIGGNAARLLSELLLDGTDRLLLMSNVNFTRFVDDYYLFARTEHEAHRHLILLSEKLQQNEGLSLQKAKTRIMTSGEFLDSSEYAEEVKDSSDDNQTFRRFRSLKIPYDPYAEDPVENYKEIQSALAEFDLNEMLQTELRKSRIHEPTTRKLLTAIRALDSSIKLAAVDTVLLNLEILAPVFPKVTLLLKDILALGDKDVNRHIFQSIRELFTNNSPIVNLNLNVAYCLRVLAFDDSPQTDTLLNSIYLGTDSIVLRRDIINVMTHRRSQVWLSDRLKQYGAAHPWEKRALLLASYVLNDQGSHWRKGIRSVGNYENILKSWGDDKVASGKFDLPL